MTDESQVLFVGGPLAGSVRGIASHVSIVTHQSPKPAKGPVAHWASDGSIEVETHEYRIEHFGKLRVGLHDGTDLDELLAEVFTAYMDKVVRISEDAKRHRVETIREAEMHFARQYQILNPVDANHVCFMDAFRLGVMFGRNGFKSIEELSKLDWREKALS